MRQLKILLLLAAAVTIIQPAVGELLLLKDITKVFREIAAPYEDKKSLRNTEIDRQVDIVIEQMSVINPDLLKIHSLLKNLSADIPVYERNFKKPLSDFKSRVQFVTRQLQRCVRQVSHLHAIPIPSSSEEDSEEIAGPEPQVEIDDHGAVEQEPAESEQQNLAFKDLLTPVQFDNAILTAILEMHSTNSTVSLRDAADSFRMVADRISRQHLARFVALIPKITQVKTIIRKITDHVIGIKVDLEKVSEQSNELYTASQTCVDELSATTIDLTRASNAISC